MRDFLVLRSRDLNKLSSAFEDAPLVELMYLVFTRMSGGGTVGDSGLCGCVPCLSSAIVSLR